MAHIGDWTRITLGDNWNCYFFKLFKLISRLMELFTGLSDAISSKDTLVVLA